MTEETLRMSCKERKRLIVMEQVRTFWHRSQIRMVKIMKLLESFGVHAKAALPELKEIAEWCRTEEGFPEWARKEKREAMEAGIRRIEATEKKPD